MTGLFDFSTFPTINTRRLVLRRMTPEDAPAMLRVFSDSEVGRYLSSGRLETMEQALAWINWMNSYFDQKEGLRWGITLKGDNTVIGSGGIHGWQGTARYAEVGYDLGRPYWGQGYATETARALIEFAWEHMDLNRIEADVWAGNSASVRLLEKLGFKHEGTWRERAFKDGVFHDVYQFGLLRHEYNEVNPS